MLEHRCLLSVAPSTVVGRFVFYDNSHYDGGIPGVNSSDDHAIASDKAAYLPGSGPATFANVIGYDKGINGIMVDLLGGGDHAAITADTVLDNFTFKVGNNNSASAWATGPSPTTVTVRPGAGTSGADRVELIWPSGSIKEKWLQVTVKSESNTGSNIGLAANDIFFFGDAVADSGRGDTAVLSATTSVDELGARNNSKTLLNNIPLTNVFDYNRDGLVNSVDQLLARNNTQTLSATRYISIAVPPALTASLANDTGTVGDGITTDPTIVGSVVGAGTITSFRAGLFYNSPLNLPTGPASTSVGQTIDMSWSTVGNINNPPDNQTVAMSDGTTGYGSVSYQGDCAMLDNLA